MPLVVFGYHGCHLNTAEVIASGVGFLPSENGYDWLGTGVYFWEDGPSRAAEWALREYGDAGAVVRATVRLGNCLNLLDTTHFDRMHQTFQEVLLSFDELGLKVPRNMRKRHDLDYVVINAYCEDTIAAGGDTFQTVRGCFPEGPALYPGSKILRETHIQLAVRDTSCIEDIAVVHLRQK